MGYGIFKVFKGSGPQLIAVLAGTINAIADGMQYGWTSPIVPKLTAPDTPVQVTENDIVWLETLYMIGGLVGLPFTIYLVDAIGRKKSVLTASFVSLIGWILIGAGNSTIYLFIGRFLTGISADIAFNASPMYVAEIAHQKIRGFLSGIIYLMMLAGVVLIYAIGPFVPIYASSMVGALLLIVQLIIFPFMPESPYYLFYVDKPKEARAALMQFRDHKNIDDELLDIEQSVKRQKEERGRPQDLLLIDSNRKAFFIMAFLNSNQHMVGVSVILMNLHLILEAAGSIYIAPEYAAIIFSGLMLISATVATCIVDRTGRKSLLMVSSVLTNISVLVLAIYFTLQYLEYELDDISWIPIASVMFFAVAFKFGLGIVPIVTTAEVFSTKIKGIGMATTDGVYVLFSTISLYIYQYLTPYGMFIPFYIFTIWCFMSTFVIGFYIPETKGKTLEEIQMMLKGNKVQKTEQKTDGVVKY